MASNSGDGYPTRDQTIPDAKIQLLTNQLEKDYAICLKGKSELLAPTNPYAEYTKVIAESDYFEDFEYSWNYTLNHWIARENSDRRTTNDNKRDNSTHASY
jgi:hypothetical protein